MKGQRYLTLSRIKNKAFWENSFLLIEKILGFTCIRHLEVLNLHL